MYFQACGKDVGKQSDDFKAKPLHGDVKDSIKPGSFHILTALQNRCYLLGCDHVFNGSLRGIKFLNALGNPTL